MEVLIFRIGQTGARSMTYRTRETPQKTKKELFGGIGFRLHIGGLRGLPSINLEKNAFTSFKP